MSLALAGCLGGQTGGEFVPGEEPPTRPASPTPVADDSQETSGPGRPGEGTGATPPNTAESGCTTQEQAVALADSSRLGFSAADMLEATLGAHASPLRWNAQTGVVSYGPEQGEGELTLTVSYDNGSAFFVPSGTAANGAELACGADHLEVDVLVRLETSGGALAEEFPARLRAQAPGRLELSRGLPLEKLAGSFFVTVPRNQKLEALNVTVMFAPSGMRGELSGVVTEQVGASAGARYVRFAEWP